MSTEQPRGALYYPYIHIRNPNWLKANLLMFPYVTRMIPMEYLDDDDDVIREFTRYAGVKEPLLRSADLWSNRAFQAQRVLAGKLNEDSQNRKFIDKYGRYGTWEREIANNPYGFQIHIQKLSEELKDALWRNSLGWDPKNKEPYDQHNQYIEVHPNIGEAVMSTLAIACAQADGLDIVGDERSGSLHECLLTKKLDSVYEAWLSTKDQNIPSPAPVKGEQLMEFILGVASDRSSLDELTPERIYALTEERKQINNLMVELRNHAAVIKAVDNLTLMEEAYKDAASDIMKKWHSDRNNFSNFGHAFFGPNTTKLATSFAGAVADKTLTKIATGAAIEAGTGWLGKLAAGGILGAGAGLIIGLIVHTGVTYIKQEQKEENSPYKFLTTLEKAGIVFRSDVTA
jgi:hypothetical protein